MCEKNQFKQNQSRNDIKKKQRFEKSKQKKQKGYQKRRMILRKCVG